MKILVLIDGTKWSVKAAMHAITLAKADETKNSSIVLFSVIDVDSVKEAAFYASKVENIESGIDLICNNAPEYENEIQKSLHREIEKEIGDLSRHCEKSGISYESKITVGSRNDEIIREADNGGYNLVVMGAYGRHSHKRTKFASVLAKKLTVPLLVIK